MPRKRKETPKKRRESSGKRWKRNRAAKARFRALGVDPKNPNHKRIELDSVEFACLFTIIGGRTAIGPGVVHAVDQHGRPVGKAVAPNIMDMVDRSDIAKISARWNDVEQIAAVKERQREERKQMQVNRLMCAVDREAFGWYRQEVPDQTMRSVLVGSNNGKDPTLKSDALLVCYRGEDGRYHVSEERWDGSWSLPDQDGHRERVGVNLDSLPITFHDEHEAQTAITFAAKMGELPRFENRIDHQWVARFAERTQRWDRNGVDMKATYRRNRAGRAEQKVDDTRDFFNEVRADLGLNTHVEPVKVKGKRVRVRT